MLTFRFLGTGSITRLSIGGSLGLPKRENEKNKNIEVNNTDLY